MNKFKPRHFVGYHGSTMSLAEACRRAGCIVNIECAWIRIFRCDWTVEDAVETPKYVTPKSGRGRASRIDEDKLKALWPTRITSKVLQDRMGHNIRALYIKAAKLGLPPRTVIWARQEGYGA